MRLGSVDEDDGGNDGHSCYSPAKWSVFNMDFSLWLKYFPMNYAVGVLIISPTVGGCELGGLRSNVDSEGGKYTSAIASVYLPPSSSTLR